MPSGSIPVSNEWRPCSHPIRTPEDLAGVRRIRVYRQPGYVFTPLQRGADRAGAVLAVGDSRAQALARADAAADRVRFLTADAGALLH